MATVAPDHTSSIGMYPEQMEHLKYQDIFVWRKITFLWSDSKAGGSSLLAFLLLPMNDALFATSTCIIV